MAKKLPKKAQIESCEAGENRTQQLIAVPTEEGDKYRLRSVRIDKKGRVKTNASIAGFVGSAGVLLSGMVMTTFSGGMINPFIFGGGACGAVVSLFSALYHEDKSYSNTSIRNLDTVSKEQAEWAIRQFNEGESLEDIAQAIRFAQYVPPEPPVSPKLQTPEGPWVDPDIKRLQIARNEVDEMLTRDSLTEEFLAIGTGEDSDKPDNLPTQENPQITENPSSPAP